MATVKQNRKPSATAKASWDVTGDDVVPVGLRQLGYASYSGDFLPYAISAKWLQIDGAWTLENVEVHGYVLKKDGTPGRNMDSRTAFERREGFRGVTEVWADDTPGYVLDAVREFDPRTI